jgi:hypothetical protein
MSSALLPFLPSDNALDSGLSGADAAAVSAVDAYASCLEALEGGAAAVPADALSLFVRSYLRYRRRPYERAPGACPDCPLPRLDAAVASLLRREACCRACGGGGGGAGGGPACNGGGGGGALLRVRLSPLECLDAASLLGAAPDGVAARALRCQLPAAAAAALLSGLSRVLTEAAPAALQCAQSFGPQTSHQIVCV